MQRHFATVALLAAIAIGQGSAFADDGPAQRLARPFPASRTGADGRLVVSRDATFGNLIVDQYAALGRVAVDPTVKPEVVAIVTDMKCSSPTGQLTAYTVGEILKGLGKGAKARLKARDPASMTGLAAATLAKLDGVSAEAILADEAIGPGAYHDAIGGMQLALVACKFFGFERKL